MAITRGQKSTFATASATTVTTSWGTNPQAGNSIVIFLWASQTSITNPTSVKDNGVAQATFTLDKGLTDATTQAGCWVYRADNISLPASGAYTVTATWSATADSQIGGQELIGKKAGGPAATNSNSNTGTAVTSGAVNDANSGSYYASTMVNNSGSDPETITTNSPFTQQFVEVHANTNQNGAGSDLISSGSQNCSITLGDSNTWDSVIVVYDPAPTAFYQAPFPYLRNQSTPGVIGIANTFLLLQTPTFPQLATTVVPPILIRSPSHGLVPIRRGSAFVASSPPVAGAPTVLRSPLKPPLKLRRGSLFLASTVTPPQTPSIVLRSPLKPALRRVKPQVQVGLTAPPLALRSPLKPRLVIRRGALFLPVAPPVTPTPLVIRSPLKPVLRTRRGSALLVVVPVVPPPITLASPQKGHVVLRRSSLQKAAIFVPPVIIPPITMPRQAPRLNRVRRALPVVNPQLAIPGFIGIGPSPVITIRPFWLWEPAQPNQG